MYEKQEDEINEINPYKLCQHLNSISTYAAFFNDFIIRLSSEEEEQWFIKARSLFGYSTIRPTELNTIEFNIPLLSVKEDFPFSTLIGLSEILNGNLTPLFTEKSIVLYYSVYLPDYSTTNKKLLETYGKTIKAEIRYIKERLVELREILEEEVNTSDSFNAENFNSMMNEFNKKPETPSSKQGPNEDSEEYLEDDTDDKNLNS